MTSVMWVISIKLLSKDSSQIMKIMSSGYYKYLTWGRWAISIKLQSKDSITNQDVMSNVYSKCMSCYMSTFDSAVIKIFEYK